MACWFADRGHEVTMLTWDEGGQAEEIIDGVKVIKLCRQDAGMKGLRFFWPKWTSLVTGLKRADADIYYQNCAECVTGQVAFWCRGHNRKFVFSAAHDLQCAADLPYKLRERILYRWGLRHADTVIVQSRKQQEMIQTNHGRDSVVLPMPCPGPTEEDYRDCERKRDGSQGVLWIGRVCKMKRPDRLLDLAEICPDLHFDLVGPEEGTEYSRDVHRRAKAIANVTVHGPASRDRVPEFYKKAKVLCCTSDTEGFPNTFLEAWSYGLPIVSTFDPDHLIVDNELGIVAHDVAGLAAGVWSVHESSARWRGMSLRARQFYLKNYTVDAVMPQFDSVFLATVNGERS
jgi:glycosyltransferase involved in cell wall biosynthesis